MSVNIAFNPTARLEEMMEEEPAQIRFVNAQLALFSSYVSKKMLLVVLGVLGLLVLSILILLVVFIGKVDCE